MSLLTVKISLQSARSKKCERSKCFAYWGGEKPKKLTGIRKLFKIGENSSFNFKKTCLLKKNKLWNGSSKPIQHAITEKLFRLYTRWELSRTLKAFLRRFYHLPWILKIFIFVVAFLYLKANSKGKFEPCVKIAFPFFLQYWWCQYFWLSSSEKMHCYP